MKLLKELSENVEYIVENTTSGKKYFIEGSFLSYATPNKNKRVYPERVMESAVNTYQKEYIAENRAISQLNHPSNGTPSTDLKEVSHRIISLVKNESKKCYEGKALILETPNGMIARNLLDGGVNLGVSSRGLGSVKSVNGLNEVQSDFMMNAIDIVSDPSGFGCMVRGLQEGTDWKLVNGEWIQEMSEVLVDIHKKKINEGVAIKQFAALMEICKKTS